MFLCSICSFKFKKKHERFKNKLSDPKAAPKTYRTILKAFVNGSKIPFRPTVSW